MAMFLVVMPVEADVESGGDGTVWGRRTDLVVRSTPELRDYNAPDPDAGLLNHLRAVANLGFQNWAIWQLNWFRGVDWVPVTRRTLAANLRLGFTFDEDELQTNFFGHPYHGGLMFVSARATGLSFVESAPYAALGSLSWELFGEREPPSANDLLVTTFAGIMLGEMTFRLSSELLADQASGGGRLLRELAAAVVSPTRGFDRLYTGKAWSDGPPAYRHAVGAELHLGVDGARAVEHQESEVYDPSLLFALDVSYGNLLPRGFSTTLSPFEFFELYAAVNLLNEELSGSQIYATGLLFGWSNDFAFDGGLFRDNHVFGLAMTYEFQGSNVANYAGLGIGPANYFTFRRGFGRWLRLGFGFDIVPILGLTPSQPQDERGYNFETGGSVWGMSAVALGPLGTLRLRSRQYAATVLDGSRGIDYVGATRISYEIDVLHGVGLGVAPMLIYRRRLQGREDASTLQGQTQLYLRLYN